MKFTFQLIIILGLFWVLGAPFVFAEDKLPWWDVQSIDTMKYSRDVARQYKNDPEFDLVIDRQIAAIAGTGATHVAIATPYDDEFTPFLTRWVEAARKYGLKIWFRGNFSGWEGWFDYPGMSRDEHTKKIQEFILYNRKLFVDGDIFSTCPECENGGPGDPRKTRDVAGYRQFLTTEYRAAKKAFATLNIKVAANYFSMNGDVARLIMDPETTKALDGLVVIDHYVKTPAQLAKDIKEIARSSGGRVMLGEFGAPIPDIHGSMSELEQAKYISEVFETVSGLEELVGINYWTAVGGSTEIWNARGAARPAVEAISRVYKPPVYMVTVKTQQNKPVSAAEINLAGRTALTDDEGVARLPYLIKTTTISVDHKNYGRQIFAVPAESDKMEIILVEKSPDWWSWIWQTFLWWLR